MAKELSTAQQKVKDYLDNRAKEDAVFAKSYANPNKSLDKCFKYIMTRAKKLALNGGAFLDDDEVFGWAVHFYDEDEVEIDASVQAQVVCNEPSTPAKPEVKKARKKAVADPNTPAAA